MFIEKWIWEATCHLDFDSRGSVTNLDLAGQESETVVKTTSLNCEESQTSPPLGVRQEFLHQDSEACLKHAYL